MKPLGGQEIGISPFSFHILLRLQPALEVTVFSMKIYTGSEVHNIHLLILINVLYNFGQNLLSLFSELSINSFTFHSKL